MKFKHVLCDFDGTLVDSSEGIISTLRLCINRAGVPILVEPSRSLIGPPLRSMIQTVIGTNQIAIARIEEEFRAEYDEHGFTSTLPFPGIAQAISELRLHGVVLHIVTNKRLVPLQRILDMLDWTRLFLTVSTLDSLPEAVSKTDVVGMLLAKLNVPINSVIMVGDSLDDQRGAQGNGIDFLWASWGYGRESCLRECGSPLMNPQDFVGRVLTT